MKKNIKLLQIIENSGNEYFKGIFNMTMEEIFNEYLDSLEFENSINKLRNGKNDKKYYFDYIKKYIEVANDFVNDYKKHINVCECIEIKGDN